MGSRVKSLLLEVETTFIKINGLLQEISEASLHGKRGKVQQLIYTRKYLYKKILTLKEKFNDLLRGTVCNIKYEYLNDRRDKVISTALLVNVNDEEIEDILKLYCKFHNYLFIKILEIQRIPTKFC